MAKSLEPLSDPEILRLVLAGLQDLPGQPPIPTTIGVRAMTTLSLGAWHSPFPELPDPILLEHTCRGLPTEQATSQPFLDAVAELAVLHRDRLALGRHAGDDRRFEHERQRCASRIDRLVAAVVPVVGEEARIHTETVGAVIDRMACWCAILHDPFAGELSGDEFVLAEVCIGELRGGYGALLDELAVGICRMPAITSLTPVTFTGRDLLSRRRH
ncbi:DUF4254 domain-containing protein [Nocardia neocaledoniensis]|uniref:DUF4254 domain-containing protein n=1 Tax=Nocardia neocaledoniensis TaxID=236511 RepID=UPI002458B8B3|nr:DUF4254 domain-containing protein [Nocardia neocaledoniensis]